MPTMVRFPEPSVLGETKLSGRNRHDLRLRPFRGAWRVSREVSVRATISALAYL